MRIKSIQFWSSLGIVAACAFAGTAAALTQKEVSTQQKAGSEDKGTVIYSLALTSVADLNKCIQINNSPTTWKFYSYGSYVRHNIYASDDSACDDYLVIPDIELSAGKSYTISIDACKEASDFSYETKFEFCYGATSEESSMIAISPVVVSTAAFKTHESEKFTVPCNGLYSIAIHDNSPQINSTAGYKEIHIKNLKVTEYNDGGTVTPPDPIDPIDPDKAKEIPFSITPTDSEIDDLTIIDANNDEYNRGSFQLGVWNYDSAGEMLVYFYSNNHLDADDYVILPRLNLTNTDYVYNVAVDSKVASSRNPESFELYVGKTNKPSEMERVYSSGTLTNDEDWFTHNIPFGITEAGEYYVAIKATSAKDQFKLMIKNISVTLTDKSVNIPSKINEVTVTAGEKGALIAQTSFMMPTVNLVGTPLSGEITVKVVSPAEEKTVTGQPGDKVNIELATVQGQNSISYTTSNSFGTGETVKADIYTGVDVPKLPVPTTTISEDNLTLHIEWDADEVGANGGYVDPSKVVYTISHYDADKKEFDDGVQQTGTFTYDYSVEPNASLRNEKFMITAENIAGREVGYGDAHGIIGKPYNLPMMENVQNGRLKYQPLSIDTPADDYLYAADFRAYTLSSIFETEDPNYPGISDEHSAAIWAFVRYGNPGMARYLFPKFSTEGIKEVKFKMNVYINSIFPATDIYISDRDSAPVKIGTITSASGEGWTDFIYVLPTEFCNKKWVNIYFDTKFTDIDTQNIFISSYSITELLPNDLSMISIDGPEDAVSIGDKAEFTAIVQNVGKNAIDAPEIIFDLIDSNNNTVLTEKVAPSVQTLAPEATMEASFSVDCTADLVGDFTVKAYIDSKDDNENNDFVERYLSVIKGNKPIIDNLAATPGSEDYSIELSWSKPDIKLTGADDFEEYDPFYYGKQIGLLKNVDGDGKSTYSYDQCVFDAATKPKAFMVINPEHLSNKLVEENYTPHSGSQYLVAFCPNDGSKANDWLISPEIKGGSILSFYVAVVGLNQFAERYEVCYSTTGNNIQDFKVLESCSVSEMKWQGKAFVLPEDARYFAIHYVSTDVFGIMIDDINYTPVINESTPFTYNVYAEGDLIAKDLTNTKFVHTGLEKGKEYKYNVTTTANGTEFNMSNTAICTATTGVDTIQGIGEETIKISGNILTVCGHDGESLVVYSADGRVVFSQSYISDNVNVVLSQGIYVVKLGSKCLKIMI